MADVPRPYHHGNLRAALIETAVALVREEGPSGLVLREVARRAGVSHNAAYRHFHDRSQLLAEVAAHGTECLREAMVERVKAVVEEDPVRRAHARLEATGLAYVGFALDEPGLFQVAFAGTREPPPADGPYGMLTDALDDLVVAGAIAPESRGGAEVACWSAVHGFAVLHLDGPLRAVPAEQRDSTLLAMLQVVQAGLAG